MNLSDVIKIAAIVLCASTARQASSAEPGTKPGKTLLLTLSALEMLHETLDGDKDVTLNTVIGDAAGSIMFPRSAAPDSLASLASSVLAAAPQDEIQQQRSEIEASTAKLTGAPPDTIGLYVSELLSTLQMSLPSEEEIFLDELIGEAADAIELDESRARGIAIVLLSTAARRLRPPPPADVKSIPRGVYVLAVHFKTERKMNSNSMSRFRYWPDNAAAAGTSFLSETLAGSMSLKRKFRRIIPCPSLSELKGTLADYVMLVGLDNLDAETVEDTRVKSRKSEDLLASTLHYKKKQEVTKVLQWTFDLVQSIELLPARNEVWSARKQVVRYHDDLLGSSDMNEMFIIKGGFKIPRNSLLFGLFEATANETRSTLTRLR